MNINELKELNSKMKEAAQFIDDLPTEFQPAVDLEYTIDEVRFWADNLKDSAHQFLTGQ